MKTRPEIEEILKKIPDAPGVYIMKDAYDRIIYVGKSKSLKDRVTSYFRGFNSHTPKTQTLVVNIRDLEYIITDNEEEALALEANLIKKNRPKFNVMLKDDKQYPYIAVTLSETFPRLVKTRAVKQNGDRYFGPYSSNYAVNQTLETLHRIFPIRKCNRDLSKVKRPCLNYHIHRCSGPCVHAAKVKEDYHQHIEEILTFLKGQQGDLLRILDAQMQKASEELAFEKAIEIRDRIEAIKSLKAEQKVVSTRGADQDIIGCHIGEDACCVAVYFVRGGKMIDHQNFIFDMLIGHDYDDLIRSFIMQFYSDTSFIPKEVLIERAIEDQSVLAAHLSGLGGHRVDLINPQRGEKRKLVAMVNRNAQEYFTKHRERHDRQQARYQQILEELNAVVSVGPVHRIEAYDISNIYGVFNVGTMVVYEDGHKKKNDYRKFKIKTVRKADDYGSMREVMDRRFSRLVDEYDEASFSRWPNLILLDGGKGQVSSVKQVMETYGLEIPVVGMVKDDRHRTRGLVFDGEVHPLKADSLLYRFIYEIQEEVHRFAIDYHRTLRSKSITASLLDEIPGVGPKRREALLKHFGNITKIQNASLEELLQVDAINTVVAKAIKEHLEGGSKTETE